MRSGPQATDIRRICRVPPRTTRAVAGGLVAVVVGALVGGAGCQPAQSAHQPTVSLRIRGTPASATVIIDEEALGTLEFVSSRGVALPPGVHHVTVKAAGYFPSDTAVDAQPGSHPVALEVALIPVPD
jgi:PEGA domain